MCWGSTSSSNPALAPRGGWRVLPPPSLPGLRPISRQRATCHMPSCVIAAVNRIAPSVGADVRVDRRAAQLASPEREQFAGGRWAGDLAGSPPRQGAAGGLPAVISQARSTATPGAWAANAAMSSPSPCQHKPFGSPWRRRSCRPLIRVGACPRSRAARLANARGTDSSMSHVLRNRFVTASRPESPVRDSTRTIEGTRGGQSPTSRRATINARARLLRGREATDASRVEDEHF